MQARITLRAIARVAAVCCSIAICQHSIAEVSADAKLRDGDFVGVCGDSITEQKQYSVLIEDYLLACQPAANIKMFQAGWGGEHAKGLRGRIESDVLPFKPTVVTTCYGMNDGNYKPIDDAIAQTYRENMTAAVEKLKAGGVRFVVVGSPGVVDVDTYKTRNDASADVYNQNLATLRDIAKDVATKNGVAFADVHGVMLDAMNKAKAKYGHAYPFAGLDGIHPGPNGHLAMAYAFLKAFGCDGDLGTITVDLAANKATATGGHKVLSAAEGTVEIESTRYPFCFYGKPEEPSTRSGAEFIPFNEDLNRLKLVVANAGGAEKVKVTWGDVSKEFAAADLAKGINLAAEFIDANPFTNAFSKLDAAVRVQQQFETPLIKALLHDLNVYTKGQADDPAWDEFIGRAIERDSSLRSRATAAVAPVKHTLRIEPVK